MKNSVVSKRYAKALIAIGKEDGQTDQYGEQLSAIVELFDTQDGFEKALINPLVNKNQRRQVLENVLGAVQPSDVVEKFLLLLFDKGRIGFLRDIASCYTELADESSGILKGKVICAAKLTVKKMNQLQSTLSKKMGKTVVLTMEEDPGLIGGVVTKIGDLVLDGSVKTMLANMRETLHKGESV